MQYPTEHIQAALAKEDAEAVEMFCEFVVLIKGMSTSADSVNYTFGKFLSMLREIHT